MRYGEGKTFRTENLSTAFGHSSHHFLFRPFFAEVAFRSDIVLHPHGPVLSFSLRFLFFFLFSFSFYVL